MLLVRSRLGLRSGLLALALGAAALSAPVHADGGVPTVPVGTGPISLAVNPTTNRVYVANALSNSVSVIDGTTNTVTATVSVPLPPGFGGGVDISGVAVDPSTNRVYVANRSTSRVTVIDGTTNSITAIVAVSGSPLHLAVSPTTSRVYVTNDGTDSVTVIDETSNTIVGSVAVGAHPLDVAVNPSTSRVYVTNALSNSVSVIDATSSSIVGTVPVGLSPYDVAVNPSTNRVYVSNYDSNSVSVIDAATNSISATVAVGSSPAGVAVNATTNRIYVANAGSGSVTVIDGSTSGIASTATVGVSPHAVGVNPTTNRVYVANNSDNTVSVLEAAPPDTTPPTARPTQSPAANAAGWNTADVIVTWNWSDNPGGSGIDPANCTSSSTSSGEGTLALAATCKDLAGNTGHASYTVKVDKTRPSTTATPVPGTLLSGSPLITVTGTATVKDAAGQTLGTQSFTCFDTQGLKLTLTATDSNGSGVANLTYAATGAQVIAATTVSTSTAQPNITTPGATTLTYSATDVAGNQEHTTSQSTIIGAGYACSGPSPSFSMPAHGTLLMTGAAASNGQSYPFSANIPF